MMKKIFALVFILVLGKMSYSQTYPLQQNLGSDSTIVISKGALQSRLAPIVISDTTAANNQRIKNYPGAQLYTANGDFYVRNATATKWVLVSSGSSGPINIYNSDGTLTGNRVLTGAGNSLTFNGISGLGINKVADSVFTVEGGIHATGGLRLDNLVSSPGTKTLRIDGQGVVSVADTTVSGGTVTSIATNNGTGITGGTITSTGTLAIDTTIISTRAWRQKGIDSVAALPKVTSVGLTMPVAFNVSGSPITSAGTLSVTAAGVASQYIRGDGQLATLPTTGGGGSSVSYYLNGSVNQGTFGGNTYYQMNKTPVLGAGTDFTISSNGYIASFITDAGDPDLLNIPAGNWDFEIYFQSSSSSGTPSFYVELYKYNGTTFTLIASSSTNPKFITSGTTVDAYYTPLPVPATTLAITDRLAIRVYVNNSGNTITLHTEDNNLCQVITTFSTGINALNGLTDQVQYFAVGTSGTDFNISSLTDTHTFNLPTASATNRGALSTTDWTTFNSKISPSDTASMLAPYLRKADTTAMLANYVNNVGYGLSKAGQVVSADSATLANYFLRRKDSLTSTNLLGYVTRTILADTAAAIRSADAGGTVTSIATNNGTGITGGTITTTGTLAIDTLLISTRAWRQKGVDSVAALVNSNVSGTTNRVSKFTGANTIGNSSIADSSVVGVAMTISSFANVGIGTATPSSRLEVSGNATIKTNFASLNLDNTTSTTPVWMKINNGGGNYLMGVANNSGTTIMSSTTSPYAFVINAQSSRDVVIGTNDLERMRVDSTGKVGIGTTTIDSMLTVAQGAYFQRGVRMSGLPTAVGTKALRIDANGTLSVADTTTGGGGGGTPAGSTGEIQFNNAGAFGASSSLYWDNTNNRLSIGAGTSPSSRLQVEMPTSGVGATFRTTGSTKNSGLFISAIESTGEVQLNASGSSGDQFLTIQTGNTERVKYFSGGQISQSGFTAIGTTAASPSQLYVTGGASSVATGIGLHFYSDADYAYFQMNGGATGGTLLDFSTSGTDYKGRIRYDNTNNYMTFGVNSASDKLVINSSFNVGIGLAYNAIGSKLQINGSAAIGYSASTAAPTNGLQVAGNSILVGTVTVSGITTINNQLLLNQSNGQVKTSNADSQGMLHIRPNAGSSGYITFTENAVDDRWAIGVTAGDGSFYFRRPYPTSSALVTITSTGNVGIGTTSPDAIFHIAKSNAGGVGGQVVIDNNAGSTIGNTAEISFLTDAGASGAGTRNARILAVNENAGNGATRMEFHTWNGGTSGVRMLISSGGNVGIGTTTIGSTLQVNGNAAIGYSASTAAPTNGLAVSGNVGIGLSSPSTQLHIRTATVTGFSADAAYDKIIIENGNSGQGANIQIVSNSTNGVSEIGFSDATRNVGLIGYSHSTNNLSFVTNGSTKLTITSGGQVTLATGANVSAIAQTGYALTGSNAQSLIDLAGTWNTTGNPTAIKLNITNTASGASADLMELQVGGVNQFAVGKSGNGYFAGDVGIGTTSPDVKLTVDGATGANSSVNLANFYASKGQTDASYLRVQGSRSPIAGSRFIALDVFDGGSTSRDLLLNQGGGNVAIGTTSILAKLHIEGDIRTSAPTSGTAANWKLGTVATVTPTSPNRTIEVEIDGVIYYIHAKTTNN